MTEVLEAIGVALVILFGIGVLVNSSNAKALTRLGLRPGLSADAFPYEGGHPKIERGSLYVWLDGEQLFFASTSPRLKCVIPRSDVLSVDLTGNVQTVSTNSSSIGGAVAGAVLAGGVGAIVGSRSSKTHEVDHSRTYLRCRFGDREHTLVFGGGAETYDGLVRVLG